jgi:hypothetical protein
VICSVLRSALELVAQRRGRGVHALRGGRAGSLDTASDLVQLLPQRADLRARAPSAATARSSASAIRCSTDG